jgi:hypothetical protein
LTSLGDNKDRINPVNTARQRLDEYCLTPPQQRTAILRQQQGAGNRIGDVIVPTTGAMVDTVLPSPRRAPLQVAQLSNKPRVIEQFDPAAVQERQ